MSFSEGGYLSLDFVVVLLLAVEPLFCGRVMDGAFAAYFCSFAEGGYLSLDFVVVLLLAVESLFCRRGMGGAFAAFFWRVRRILLSITSRAGVASDLGFLTVTAAAFETILRVGVAVRWA
jgi:hypothetical protein